MKVLKLVYFDGCPNVESAKSAITNAGYQPELVNQSSLPENDPLREFSSPTILADDFIVIGSRSKNSMGGCSIEEISAETIKKRLKAKGQP